MTRRAPLSPLLAALLGCAALWVPLVLWLLALPMGDAAALALALLALALWQARFGPALALRRARLGLALRPTSGLTPWLRGPLMTALVVAATTLAVLPLLAWQVLGPPPRLAALGLLSLLSALTAQMAQRPLSRHLNAPFVALWARRGAAAIWALIFVPVLAWVDLTLVPRDPAWAALPWHIATAQTLDAMPSASGWQAEALALVAALDALQLWAVMQWPGTLWPGLIYAVSGALAAGPVALASAALAGLAPQGAPDDQ